MSDTILVVCPHCHAPNRVPLARLSEAPVCGRCKRALFDAQPVALDAASFETHVMRGELPVHIFNPEAIPLWQQRFGGKSLL